MKNTPATPIEQIVYYADLRNEYESNKFNVQQRASILALAIQRYEKIDINDLDESGSFKEGAEYNWDELGLSLDEELILN